jgi:CRISPR/Cas system CSM-associated protein Csm2 small subunit
MENKDQPQKPKRKKSNKNDPKSLEIKSLSLKSIDQTDITSEQIRRLLKEVMMESAYESKMRSNTEVDALVHTMQEFLRSFIVIGYNMKNEPLVITNAKSQLDADALYTSLARLFISINHNGGM